MPKYGGVVTIALAQDTIGWDVGDQGTRAISPGITNEDLLVLDWTKGPAGTGETKLDLRVFLIDLMTGGLATSWTIPDANTVIFKIRTGVHWALNPESEASRLVNGRELVAEDVAVAMRRSIGDPKTYYGSGFAGWLQSVECPDKYTVIIRGKDSELTRTSRIFEELCGGIRIYPPEVIAKYGDMRNWRNSVGTGPFYLTDYVGGSSLVFKKNPNYWMKNPVGPGKGNQLPYLDGVKMLVIPDNSTRMAALRTAKVDWLTDITRDDAPQLKKSTPQLGEAAYFTSGSYIAGRIDRNLPFNDVRVRRAMTMAIDQAAIVRDYYGGEAEVLWYPVAPVFPTLYTPIEKLPPEGKELYSYNPDKAKQLLAEAGYPNGFKTEVVVSTTLNYVDITTIYKEYLSKVGINLEIKAVDNTVWQSMRMGKTHNAMILGTPSMASPFEISHAVPGAAVNNIGIDDPVINAAEAGIWAYENILKPAERARLVKERAVHTIGQAYFLTFPLPFTYEMWWPWLGNYRGEIYLRFQDYYSWTYIIWYDQELKKEMGY